MNSKLTIVLLAVVLASPGFALDWGVSAEDSTSATVPLDAPGTGKLNQTETVRLWVSQNFGRESSFVLKASVADALSWGFEDGFRSNTVSADLDSLFYSSPSFTVGRTTFRDFGGTVLNTTLDGVQASFSAAGIDFFAAAATSALVFKDQSTVVISQADLTDRTVDQDWSKPSTLFAPPRAIGLFEASFAQIVTDQTFRVSEILQYDFREKVSKADANHDPTDSAEPGAPVSMTYTGVGGSGRVVGSLYWDAWTYLGLGTTLTPIGTYKKGNEALSQPTEYQKWKTAWIVNGIASASLTLLVPELAFTIVNLGVQAGSWDKDGISPDQNLAEGDAPSLYTGYFGVSRTGGSLVFTPQPVNMVTTQLLYSFKPFAKSRSPLENFQVAASGFVFFRPSTGSITEAGLNPKSEALYLASEADVNLLFRPASDWGGNINLGLLFPNADALTRGTEFKAQVGLNLSF